MGGNNVLGGARIGGNSSLIGSSLAAGAALNAGEDELPAQVLQTELAAATEQAEGQELQVESAKNADASSVAQAAQHKMQTDNELFKRFDQVISG